MGDPTPSATAVHLDDGPLTPRQLFIASTAAGGLFLDGYNVLIFSGALLGIIPAFHLKGVAIGLIGASVFAGMIIGTMVAGPLTDRVGRKPVFIVDMLLFIVAAGLCLFVSSPTELMVLRLLTGIAIGADMPASSAIITEFSPRARRGTLNAITQPYWLTGSFIGALVSLLIYHVGGVSSWRWILASGLVPAVVVLVLRRTVPETPRWLLSRGRIDEARTVLMDTTHNPTIIDHLAALKTHVSTKTSARPLFRGEGLRRLVFVSLYWFFGNITGSTILIYTPVIVKSIVTPSTYTSLEFTAGFNLLYVLFGLIVSLFLIEKWGRRPMGIWPWLSAAILIGLLAFVLHNRVAVALLFAVATIFMFGAQTLVYFCWGVELFPTNVRGRALGFSNGVGKIGSLLGVLLFPGIFATSPKDAMLIIAGLMLIGSLITLKMAPETKGLSLDDLEQVTQ
ncbi:MAG: sugar porter family MFS transporter [Firmicutes bacterium]|nr:sugar porter family MFS transporter [Bacillota bacterium]